jgi:C-terminal processing protease CtpA/Prc
VTNDLQAVHKDRHLRLLAPRPGDIGRQIRRGLPPGLKAISKSGWLADGVAYIRFELFPGDEQTLAELRKFIDDHKGAKTLIIDARTHRGGGPEEMDVLFPQLFAEESALVGMDTRLAVEQRRGGPPAGADQFMRKTAGPEGVVRRLHYAVPAKDQGGLAKAKVYLLTSKRTGSAGEHLSLALKRTKRATLIGESTAGAGHYGGIVPLGYGYAAFIPVGRSFDPDTNQGWEGTGVKPDIEVPADQALDEALKRAGVNKPAEAALAELR